MVNERCSLRLGINQEWSEQEPIRLPESVSYREDGLACLAFAWPVPTKDLQMRAAVVASRVVSTGSIANVRWFLRINTNDPQLSKLGSGDVPGRCSVDLRVGAPMNVSFPSILGWSSLLILL